MSLFLESIKLQLHDAIYRLRFYSNSLIHILSLSNSHNNVASIQKNRGDKSHHVIVALRRISCHGRNYSQPYFFKRNQSSDNRSHGFGAKFLLKKLSASDFSYERKSALTEVNESYKGKDSVRFMQTEWSHELIAHVFTFLSLLLNCSTLLLLFQC